MQFCFHYLLQPYNFIFSCQIHLKLGFIFDYVKLSKRKMAELSQHKVIIQSDTNQESSSFKKQDFVCLDYLSEVAQVALELLYVRNELIDDAGPRLQTQTHTIQASVCLLMLSAAEKHNRSYFIQRLVPNRRPKAGAGQRARQSLQVLLTLFKYLHHHKAFNGCIITVLITIS